MYTRRRFLKTAAGAAASIFPGLPVRAAVAAMIAAGADSSSRRISDGWEFLKATLGGPWEIWHSAEVAVWEPVKMPHCFNAYDACDPDVQYYQGNGWYRTHVSIANPYPGGRTLLHFEGAGQTVAFYVGESLTGKHTGGYDEFVFDITDQVKAFAQASASNPRKTEGIPIAVLCDNSRDLDRMPSDLSDFSLYGGMYRHVNLVYVPAVSLETVHVKTNLPTPQGPAEITVTGILYNPSQGGDSMEISVQVVDAKGVSIHQSKQTLKPWKDSLELAQFMISSPQLWSPKTPQLYECHITLSSASGQFTASEKFGIRHTEFVEHGPFKLNGERLLLRGTHRHEDHAGYASAIPDDVLAQEMQLIKDMGANFIRLAHYQQSRRVLEHCDRLGLLVWEEVPWCRGGIGGEVFQEMGRRTLRHMIEQHYNHPCVLMWGLGNEDDWPTEYPSINQKDIRAYMQELNTLAHELDPSRSTSFRRCDFARDIPDVYSPSIWAGWYRGTYPEYLRSLETERERVKRMIHIEWGADSHAGRHSENPDRALANIGTGSGTEERGLDYLPTGGEPRVSKDGDWSETYACNLFDWHLKTQESLPWLTGAAQWVFKDFTTPLRVENPVPRVNQKGLIERDMTKKEAYYVFQSYWSDVPMVRLYSHSWPIRWGDTGEQKVVKVYSNCPKAELFVNGRSVGVRHRDMQDFPAAGLRWTTPFIAGKNHLRVVAENHGKTVIDEIEFIYQTEKWGAPTEFRLKEISRGTLNGHETVTVEVALHDANGIQCLDAKNQIRYSVAGTATLIDNLGTPNGSRVVQLYNGRSRITMLRNTGSSSLAVTTSGVPAGFCTIT